MQIEQTISNNISSALSALYGIQVEPEGIQLQKTKKEFDGHLTLVVFPWVKIAKKSPEQTAEEIGSFLVEHCAEVMSYTIVKGFLNLTIGSESWTKLLNDISGDANYGIKPVTEGSPLVMIEYSSPNTNKPLHLGHIRNNLLGFSLSRIMEANGNRVVKTNIVNDRGIHICKSMLAWKRWGEGLTPETANKKGDHLVGDFYVLFDKAYKAELRELEQRMSREDAERCSPLMAEAREMLVKWEAGDDETVALWRMMNGWVYKGFSDTYERLGVDFDKIYYESETYLEGRDKVLEGLRKGVLYQKEDGSVWADLTDEGLDHKLLLRGDGTSVYMTQDIGTAKVHPILFKDSENRAQSSSLELPRRILSSLKIAKTSLSLPS